MSVTVTCVDDTPIAVNDSATVAEDSGAGAIDVLANDTDVDGGPKTIASVSQTRRTGRSCITGGGAGLTYQPDANYCNSPAGDSPDTFTYTLNGGSTATVSVTVTCAPDDPVVDTSAGSTSYTENAAATVIDAAVTVTDPDAGTTITGATVQITRQLRQRPGRAGAGRLASGDRGVVRRRHADADGQREPGGLPGRAARRDLRQQLREPVDAAADDHVHGDRRHRPQRL